MEELKFESQFFRSSRPLSCSYGQVYVFFADDMNWNALEWDRAAEELTWERVRLSACVRDHAKSFEANVKHCFSAFLDARA